MQLAPLGQWQVAEGAVTVLDANTEGFVARVAGVEVLTQWRCMDMLR
jgi:hypothetical protein